MKFIKKVLNAYNFLDTYEGEWEGERVNQKLELLRHVVIINTFNMLLLFFVNIVFVLFVVYTVVK